MLSPLFNFEYTIRRSQRAKRTRIVVTNEKVEVVAPDGISERRIHAFVNSQAGWVSRSIKKIRSQKRNIVDLAPAVYQEGAIIPFQGEKYELRIQNGVESVVNRTEKIMTVESPCFADLSKKSEEIRQLIISWMKQQARIEVERYMERHKPLLCLRPGKIRIKTQKSRWGSCGIHNDININWLLILAPPEVLEYVVVHELCHIRERNHSARFWQLVAAHLPAYQQHRNWLKLNGASLMSGI